MEIGFRDEEGLLAPTEKSAGVVMAIAAVLVIPNPVHADAWQSDFTLPGTIVTEYVGNPELVVGEENATASRARLQPQYSLAWADGVDRLHGEALLRLEVSNEPSTRESRADPQASIGWSRRLAHGNVGIGARYDAIALRATEAEEAGLAGTDGSRRSRAVRANWDYALTERAILGWLSEYEMVRYDIEEFSDFKQFTTGVNIKNAVDARTSLVASVDVQYHRPTSGEGDNSDLYTVDVGMEHKTTERTTWNLGAGAYHAADADKSTGWNGSGGVDYRLPVGMADLNYERNVTNNTGHGLTKIDRVGASLNFSFDEKTTVGFNTQWRKMRTAVTERSTEIGFMAMRRLSPDWGAGASCRYLTQNADGSGEARGYVIGIGLTYLDSRR